MRGLRANRHGMKRTGRRSARGQALPEFALVAPIFLILVLGIVDFGRAIYLYNGLSQASREIARAASVNPGAPLGSSTQTQNVLAVQRKLVPGMGNPQFSCVDSWGDEIPGNGSGGCASGDYVKVLLKVPYSPVALFGLAGPIQLSSSSTNQVQ
jgi:hypothetical protein